MTGRVAVRYGSPNDATKMAPAVTMLKKFGIPCDAEPMSAHRDSERVANFATNAEADGYVAIIAGAGLSNALAGAIAAQTDLPVTAVPLSGDTSAGNGLDSILSSLQMPPGMPVGTVSLDGAANAALLVTSNLARSDPDLGERYRRFRERGSQVKAPMPIHSGKVRDTFELEEYPGLLLQFVSNRISVFDYVLKSRIPGKGAVLANTTRYWLGNSAIMDIVPNHFATGLAGEIKELGTWARPLVPGLLIVKKLNMISLECIVRGFLEGSAWREYQKFGTMHGEQLREGMVRCQKLPKPVFTPSTKADEGEHDENISVEQAVELLGDPSLVGKLEEISLALYQSASQIAEEKGILILDTKFEFGYDPETGEITLADEVFTPATSRCVDAATFVEGEAPMSMDKEYVRHWVRNESGWDEESGDPPPLLPPHVIWETNRRYQEIQRRLLK